MDPCDPKTRLRQRTFERESITAALVLIVILWIAGCTAAPWAGTATPSAPSEYAVRVVSTYPHDPGAFTQGLTYSDGFLYEGTGLQGRSSLRKVELGSGKVLQLLELDAELFGEGIAVIDDRVVQLTLTSGLGFVYDRSSFAKLGEFSFVPEGWGLTYDGEHLIMSDGTAELRVLDPENFQEISRIAVSENGSPVLWLNELEWVEGEIFANVWQSDRIARISPQTGAVTGWIDLSELRAGSPTGGVFNGIAYDADSGRLFVSGKNWPVLFEIEMVPLDP